MPQENSPKPITKVYPVAYFQGSQETGMCFYALKTKDGAWIKIRYPSSWVVTS